MIQRLLFLALLPIVLVLCGVGLRSLTEKPLFDDKILGEIAHRARQVHPDDGTVQSLNSTITYIHQQLQYHYPGHVEPEPIWISNLAGGFKTGMLLFHGSLSEYVMIWGSAVDTTGHSGRNWAEFHDWLIAGKGIWWKEGGLTTTTKTTGLSLTRIYSLESPGQVKLLIV